MNSKEYSAITTYMNRFALEIAKPLLVGEMIESEPIKTTLGMRLFHAIRLIRWTVSEWIRGDMDERPGLPRRRKRVRIELPKGDRTIKFRRFPDDRIWT